MNRKFAKRLLRTFILSAAALVIGMVLAYNQIKSQVNEETNDNGRTHSLVSSVKLGGDFTLVDHNGRRVTQDIFNDHYVLLYFGFTYCPAICPTELQKISAVLKRFEETDPELLEKILPVFTIAFILHIIL